MIHATDPPDLRPIYIVDFALGQFLVVTTKVLPVRIQRARLVNALVTSTVLSSLEFEGPAQEPIQVVVQRLA